MHLALKLQFGEVDIDGSLVAAKTTGAEDIVMLNNGCLCCTVRGDLVRMISELVNKKKGKFDHIVIETTGMKSFPIMRMNAHRSYLFMMISFGAVLYFLLHQWNM